MNQRALVTLWNITQEHVGTSGARTAAGILLGLYNGKRFPFDLTDLRGLDTNLFQAAMAVIQGDAIRCQMEVHEWLNRLTGRHDFGARFEQLAHEYSTTKRGRCSKALLAEMTISPTHLVIRQSEKEAA